MADKNETTLAEDSESDNESSSPPKAVKTMGAVTKASTPTTAAMVIEALEHLKQRGGSSLAAIKKYIFYKYNLDMEKRATFIRKYLKASVADGTLIQTKGKGAAGSFKLPSVKGKVDKATKIVEDEAPPVKKQKTAKKTDSEKVSSSTKKQASSKQVVKKAPTSNQKTTTKNTEPTEPKSPSRTKKLTKSPTSKPKAPKAKKASKTQKSPQVGFKKMAAAEN